MEREHLTKKQEGFVKDYLDTGNATESARRNYNVKNDNVAGAIGGENLQKPKIQAYLESMAEKVSSNMVRLALSAESEQVQVTAGKDVLDRAGYKPTDKTDITTNGQPLNQDTQSKIDEAVTNYMNGHKGNTQ